MTATRPNRTPLAAAAIAAALAFAASGCAQVSTRPAIDASSTVHREPLDRALEDRLLALDPERVSERDVREVLSRAPAPRIIALQGSVPIVTMAPFSEFLIEMGYPADRLRNPHDGRYTYSSFTDSREMAGTLAWYYEREGSMPMLIGHSQGGMLTVKVLQDLAGASGDRVPVWNPVRDAPEDRWTIVDPVTGTERPVVGLRVPYAAALATGSLMRVLLGQWEMIARLRSVPDSVEEFTGYFIAGDLIAGTGPDAARDDPYRPTGHAHVRNVMLPGDYGHITLPLARHLAENPATRRWISGYDPRVQPAAPPAIPDADLSNIVHAADIWYSVKKHWCLEAQRQVRASRALHRASN